MEKRTLGKTGEQLTIVGFGGIVVKDVPQPSANRLVAKAVEERGLNYFDVAPTYGNAQERLGPALEPYRDGVFLACKTHERSAKGAAQELDESLRMLRTDHVDLYQLHAMTTLDEVDEVTGPGGALETFIKARDEGKVRYIGFSAHTEEAALALMDRFDFDTILFPFNWAAWYEAEFGQRVLDRAQEKEMGILALKALAKRQWKENEPRPWTKTWYRPVESPEEAEMALRFTLSRPITAAVSPGHAELLWWACDAAENFRPLTPEEERELALKAEGLEPVFPH